MKKFLLTYLAIFLFMFLLSCKILQPYRSPALTTPGTFRDGSADTTTIATLPWNQVFTDTILQTLIGEAIAQNLDLKIAYTRIQQAQAYYIQSGAVFFPTLSANAQASESKLSAVQGFGIRNSATQFQLGLSAGWEADLWGKLRSARRASLASLLQSESYARTVQTGLVADIANYYYFLQAMDRQLVITQQTVQNWIATVETMKALKEAAVVTGAAVVQSEANRYAAEVTIPDLKQNIRETENALSILLGRPAGDIRRSLADTLATNVVLQTGVPAQLLSNRPDVRQAEQNFRYYFEQTNLARTYFYPSFTITGSGGLSSLALSTFFSGGSVFASVAGGLAQPIFNQRLNRTRLSVARSQQQEALLQFQQVMLRAGQEVSDAMSLYNTAREKITVRGFQLNALVKSVEYSEELLRYGSANYTEVLNARQSLLSAELSNVNDRLQQQQAGVNLYRALGGGWR